MRWLLLVALAACRAAAPPAYLKGQLHVHTSNSGDSGTSPSRVASWYAEHGFDFIVLTDHNHVSTLTDDRMLVFPGVELTQNVETCDPPRGTTCNLHVNALFVTDTRPVRWTPPAGVATRLDLYRSALEEVRRRGGIAQLNHPNFRWGADAALVHELVEHGLVLFEVANESSDVANDGDAEHPSTEAIWDAVLTAGDIIYGTATDDAHHYDDADAVRAQGRVPDVGNRGWVMVHAARDRASIRDALARGDFYSSTGVLLRRIDRSAETLEIEADVACEFAFIGSGGRVLARSHGRIARFPLAQARGGYVRATATDDQGRRAWIQPIRVP